MYNMAPIACDKIYIFAGHYVTYCLFDLHYIKILFISIHHRTKSSEQTSLYSMSTVAISAQLMWQRVCYVSLTLKHTHTISSSQFSHPSYWGSSAGKSSRFDTFYFIGISILLSALMMTFKVKDVISAGVLCKGYIYCPVKQTDE